MLERFHRTLEGEEVYWNLYDSTENAHRLLAAYRECYIRLRSHCALRPASGGGTLVPADVYLDGLTVTIPN